MAEISFLRIDAALFFVTLRDHARGEGGEFGVNRTAARPVPIQGGVGIRTREQEQS